MERTVNAIQVNYTSKTFWYENMSASFKTSSLGQTISASFEAAVSGKFLKTIAELYL